MGTVKVIDMNGNLTEYTIAKAEDEAKILAIQELTRQVKRLCEK